MSAVDEAYNALRALRLQLPESVVNDVTRLVGEAFGELREAHRGAIVLNTDLVVGARAMQAEAWDEGYELGQQAARGIDGGSEPAVNPYRTEEA